MKTKVAEGIVRLGQVGVGYWGRNLLRNFTALDGAEVVATCDRRSEVLDRVAAEYSGVKTTANYEELLADESIDAIIVSTETPLHAEMSEQAVLSGKHVFVEKPMARTLEEAERLVAAAESKDRIIMVGHLLIYHPAFRYVDSLIESGELGDIYYLYSTRVNLGIIRKTENALESLAPHDLAVALKMLRKKPVAVSAQGQAYLQPGIEDVAFATVFFEDNRLAHLHTSWLDPHKARKTTVVGSRRMAVIDDMETVEKVRLYDKGVDSRAGQVSYANYAESMSIRVGDISIPKVAMEEPLRVACRHFIDCVREGKTPETDGRNGLEVVRLLAALQRSLRSNGAIVEV